MTTGKYTRLLTKLEELSILRPDRAIRIKGFVSFKEDRKEILEIVVFRGFTSSTTHPTNWDPQQPTIPNGSTLLEAELLEAPIIPTKEKIILGPIEPQKLTIESNWN